MYLRNVKLKILKTNLKKRNETKKIEEFRFDQKS